MARRPDNMPAVQPAYTAEDQYGTNNTVATGGPNSVENVRGRNYKHFMDREEQVQMARRYMQTRGLPMTQKNLLTTMAWLSGEDIPIDEPTGVDAAMATVDAGDAGIPPAAPSGGGGSPAPTPPPPPEQPSAAPAALPQADITGPGAGVLAATLAARHMASRYLPGRQQDAQGREFDALTGEILDPETADTPRLAAPVDTPSAAPEAMSPAAQIGGRGEGGMLTEGEARTALSNARNNPGEAYDIGNGSSLMTMDDGALVLSTPAGHMQLDADEGAAAGQLREVLRALQRM